jgi:hypothetical protein
VSTSDVPSSPAGTPESESEPPDVLARVPRLATGRAGVDLRVEDPRSALPLGKTGASPRTPSIVPRTCKLSPAGHAKDNWLEILHARTVSPSAHPRPASGGAADFFLASALRSPPDLATRRRERRAMHPTDVCHPNVLRVPAPRVFPARSPARAGGMPHGVLGSVRRDRGTGRFTTSRTASADRHRHVTFVHLPHGVVTKRGRLVPTVWMRPSL